MYHTLDLHFQGLPSVIGSFLVDSSDGWVLIESGPYSCWPALCSDLEEKGLAPSDIRHVLLTHIHFDHAGAAWALAESGANIHVHPAGAPHLIRPEKLVASARRIYQEDMDRLWGDIRPIDEERVRIAEDMQEIRLGNRTFIPHFTPGHAIHHIAWQLDTSLFTGDVGGIRIGRGIVAPPCPPPEFNREDWLDSIRRIRQLEPEELVLTHYGRVGDIHSHLDELERAIDLWVDFFRLEGPETPPEVLTSRFMDFIDRKFYSPEMDAGLREQYNEANPPWMSVAGITRYLRKQAEKGNPGM